MLAYTGHYLRGCLQSGGGGGGKELNVKDTFSLMNMNPAYQSRETAVHTYA